MSEPSAALRAKAEGVIAALCTPIEREESKVYWGEGEALVLVPGETGHRKGQAIIVDERQVMSAYVKSWRFGISDTRK